MAEAVAFGIVGLPASGKGFIGDVLVRLGCERITGSTLIKKYAHERGISMHNRADSAAVRTQMDKDDPLAFVRPFVEAKHDTVHDGVRVPNDAYGVREHGNLVLIAAICDSDEERFKRAMDAFEERGSRDKTTLAEFLADEAAEYYNPDPSKISVSTLIDMADYRIDTLALSKPRVEEMVHNIYALTD